MTREVVVYSTPACPYCIKTKDWLSKHNVKFNEINVAADGSSAKKMIEESGQMGIPVIKISEEGKVKNIVVGFDIEALEEEFNN